MPAIDLYASSEHYAEHLWPIWLQLEQLGLAGSAYSARAGSWWRSATLPRASAHRGTQPVLVSSYVDVQRTHPAPVVYVEHGAGQSYDGDVDGAGHPSYSGGEGLDRVVLFVAPSERVAARWRERYPSTPVVVAGCAKLDRWHAKLNVDGERESEDSPESLQRIAPRPLTVAVTFHWPCPLVPETRSALPHYDAQLPALVAWARSNDVTLLGHGHPRIWFALARRWEQLDVEPVRRFDDVLDRADVLVFDNTSAGFEFASLDRPVVVLNAPWYRRDVEHGGRFWTWADVGPQVDEPHELYGALEDAIEDLDELSSNRRRVVADVYAHVDGQAAIRAAAAISEVLPHVDEVQRERRRTTRRSGF